MDTLYALTAWIDPAATITVVFGFVILIMLLKWHSDDTPFDIRHILIDRETERVSLHKFGQFVALSVSTMLIWHETLKGRLSEWLFISYMASWAGAFVATRWLDHKHNERLSSKTPDEEGRP